MDHLLLNEGPHPYRPDESPLIGDQSFGCFRKETTAIGIFIMRARKLFSQVGISATLPFFDTKVRCAETKLRHIHRCIAPRL